MVNAMDIYIQQLAEEARKECENAEIIPAGERVLNEEIVEKVIQHFKGTLKQYTQQDIQTVSPNIKRNSFIKKTTGNYIFEIGYVYFDVMDILHELGHAFLELDDMEIGGIRCIGDMDVEAKELESTQWARNFIMPINLFEQAVIECSTRGKCNIKKVSELFNVEYVQVLTHGREMLIWE